MKILQLSPQFPFPADMGGKISIANNYIFLSRHGADVTLFSYVEPGEKIEQKHIREAEQYGKVINFEACTRNTKARIIRSFFTFSSIYLTKHINGKVKLFFDEYLKEHEFDVIHADHTAMMPLALYVASIIKKPIGLRLHNVEYMIWQRYGEGLAFYNPLKLYIKQQASILKKAERKLYTEADTCFTISSVDYKRACELSPTAHVVNAAGGVNDRDWQPDPSVERNPLELIHATIYSWIHNINALKWFLDKVLPLVHREVPGISLTLIGRDAPEWLDDYKVLGVNRVGYVDKVQPYLNRASIYIAPLFVGSGIRIKILEAMAMELPVVATPVSAEGIHATEEEGLFLVDNERDFARKLAELTSDPERVRELGRKARKFIVENFSWEKNVRIMYDEYAKLSGL